MLEKKKSVSVGGGKTDNAEGMDANGRDEGKKKFLCVSDDEGISAFRREFSVSLWMKSIFFSR